MSQFKRVIILRNVKFDEKTLYLLKSEKKESLLILEAREVVSIIEIEELPNANLVLENLGLLEQGNLECAVVP